MNPIFDWFGGRRYFYMVIFLTIATWLCIQEKISGTEWAAFAALMFNGVVVAKIIEANGKLKYANKDAEEVQE